MIGEASPCYWLAVMGATIAAAFIMTLVWLDTPTKKERDRLDRRDKEDR